MKRLAIAFIVSFPLLLSAQQKSDSQDLQKQIDQLKKEIYSKISVLQDSLISNALHNGNKKSKGH